MKKILLSILPVLMLTNSLTAVTEELPKRTPEVRKIGVFDFVLPTFFSYIAAQQFIKVLAIKNLVSYEFDRLEKKSINQHQNKWLKNVSRNAKMATILRGTIFPSSIGIVCAGIATEKGIDLWKTYKQNSEQKN